MQPGETAVRLRVQVAPEDAQAHGGLVVGLVGILLGVLVSGLGGGHAVVFASAHGAIVVSSMHNGVGLLRAKRRPERPVREGHAVWKGLDEALEQCMPLLIHVLDLWRRQEPGPVQHVPVQEIIVRHYHARERKGLGGVADRGGGGGVGGCGAAAAAAVRKFPAATAPAEAPRGQHGQHRAIAIRSVALIAWFSILYPYSPRASRPLSKLCLL